MRITANKIAIEHTNRPSSNPAQRVGGTTLIEVLITVCVVAIGLLGVAGLQAKAVSNSSDSIMYSRAAFLASDIVERMRNNASAVRNQAYKRTSVGGSALTLTKNCAAAHAVCTVSELANFDMYQWLEQRVRSSTELPEGDALITVGDNNSDGFVTSNDWAPTRATSIRGTAETVEVATTVTVRLRWRGRLGGNCDVNGADLTTQSYLDADAVFKCYTVVVQL